MSGLNPPLSVVSPTVDSPLQDDDVPPGVGLDPQALFASIVVNANDVVLVTEAEPVESLQGGPKVIYVNPAFTRMTGYEPDEIIGLTPRILQSPKTDRAELDRLRAALKAWKPVEVELLNVHKDGTEFWVQINITPVCNAVGWWTHWVAIQREITVRKRREIALATMLESTSDLMIIVDDQHVITASSSTSEKLLGLSSTALQGRSLSELVHPDDATALQVLLTPSLLPRIRQNAVTEVRVRHDSGHWRWLEISAGDLDDRFSPTASDPPVRNGHHAAASSNEPRGAQPSRSLLLVCSDITDYRNAQDALHELNRRFRSAFDDAPIGMSITSLSGTFLQVNHPLTNLLGRSAEELLDMTVHDITHPADTAHAERHRAALLRGERTSLQHETRFLHADGSVVGILHSSSVVHGPGGVPGLIIDHVEDITERRAFEERLQHQALHDPLTSLPNRALFMDRLQQALHVDDRGLATTGRVAVLFCDIDRFKTINDTHGHHVGDLVLTAVAHRLQTIVRKDDTVARLGGDELVVLCTDLDQGEASATALRLRQALEEPVIVNGRHIVVTVSVGIALSVPGRTTAEQLLRDSDDAMYQAKDAGRDQYVLHDEAHGAHVRRRILLEGDLPAAIDQGHLRLYYQPQVDLRDASIVGLEALIRWEHPELGLLMPADFIDIAEEAGLMRDLGRWVLRQAVSEMASRQADEAGKLPGLHDGLISDQSPGPDRSTVVRHAPIMWMNVSASELEDPGFAAAVEAALQDYGLPGTAFGLEITESVLMINLNRAHLTLTRLRSLGVHVAIDDFGTGYSSLSYIAQFPVTVIKIDRSFTAGLDDPDRRRESFAIITAVIGLAHALHLQVIAEGIETTTQAQILHGLGCDHGQGYLYGRPAPLLPDQPGSSLPLET